MKHTKVVFLIEKQEGDLPCNVFAYFPEIRSTKEGGMFTCYAHIGQHSACHENYAKGCKQAELNDFWELLRELIEQGYKNLQILNNSPIEYHRKPTQSEIKRGYGATHYQQFQPSNYINPKTGLIKGRIKGIDGLIYTC